MQDAERCLCAQPSSLCPGFYLPNSSSVRGFEFQLNLFYLYYSERYSEIKLNLMNLFIYNNKLCIGVV